jgi:transposase-like protein
METPKTLQQAIQYYSDEQVCIDAVAEMRWPNGVPVCPACRYKGHYYLKTQKRWKCKACHKQFTVKLGTVFEDSPISLTKWLPALWMLCNCKNGISSYELSRDLGVSQKAAWFMLQRLRLGLQDDFFGSKMSGEVEVDETRHVIPTAEVQAEDVIAQGQIPGAAVALAYNSETVYEHGFGHRDANRGLPVTPDTRFGLGSVTKSFPAPFILVNSKTMMP